MRAGRRSSGSAAPFTLFFLRHPLTLAPFACSLGPEPPSNQLLGQSRRGVLDTGGTMPPGLAHAFPLALSQPLAFSGHPPYPLCLVRLVYPPTKPEADIRQSLVPPPDSLSPLGVALFPQWRHCADGLQEPLAPKPFGASARLPIARPLWQQRFSCTCNPAGVTTFQERPGERLKVL